MKHQPLESGFFIENRNKFSKPLKDRSLAAFNIYEGGLNSEDQTLPFKQNNDLFYLSAIDMDATTLLLYTYCPKPLD